jgi:hypothetical protein
VAQIFLNLEAFVHHFNKEAECYSWAVEETGTGMVKY